MTGDFSNFKINLTNGMIEFIFIFKIYLVSCRDNLLTIQI